MNFIRALIARIIKLKDFSLAHTIKPRGVLELFDNTHSHAKNVDSSLYQFDQEEEPKADMREGKSDLFIRFAKNVRNAWKA